MVEYLAARIEPDEHGRWVAGEHTPRCLAAARSELEYALCVGPGRHVRLFLKALVVGQRLVHQREKCVGIPAL